MRRVSTYTAGSPLPDRRPSYQSNPGGGTTWTDIVEADWVNSGIIISASIAPSTGANPVNLDQVALDNINSLMWVGSNVVTVNGTQQTINLPAGVTPDVIWGFRKKISSDGPGTPPYAFNLQFLLSDPTSSPARLTRTAQPGATWDSGLAGIGRVSLPDYFIMKKSIQDPRDPIDCTYTSSLVGCNSPCGGVTGVNTYNITGWSGALYGGACPAFKGVTLTGAASGVATTEACTSAMCPMVSGPGFSQWGGGGAAPPAVTCATPWQTLVGSTCTNRSFRMYQMFGASTPVPYYLTFYSSVNNSLTTTPDVNASATFTYDPTAKTLYMSYSGITGYLTSCLAGSACGTAAAAATRYTSSTGSTTSWNALAATGGTWEFKNTSTNLYVSTGTNSSSATSATNTRWILQFI